MRIKSLTTLTLTLCLVLVLSFGCATTAVDKESTKGEAPADWKFHSTVDVNFVTWNLSCTQRQTKVTGLFSCDDPING